jgi:hypothetical protein
MSEVIVYGVPGSPYVRAALLGFEEKGATPALPRRNFGTARKLKERDNLCIPFPPLYKTWSDRGY